MGDSKLAAPVHIRKNRRGRALVHLADSLIAPGHISSSLTREETMTRGDTRLPSVVACVLHGIIDLDGNLITIDVPAQCLVN